MAPTATARIREPKSTVSVSPASSSTMGPALDGRSRSSVDAVEQEGRNRQRSHSEDEDSNQDVKTNVVGDSRAEVSPNSDEPARKRRRSRKGLDKRFECAAEGCGKSYSRAEHL
jgi:hypothetical protein